MDGMECGHRPFGPVGNPVKDESVNLRPVKETQRDQLYMKDVKLRPLDPWG